MKGSKANPQRRAAGLWLRQRRLEANLTQNALAKLVGINYYTFISQLEAGKGRVPPDKYADFANALGVDVEDFTWAQLRFYEPEIYKLLHGSDATNDDPNRPRHGNDNSDLKCCAGG